MSADSVHKRIDGILEEAFRLNSDSSANVSQLVNIAIRIARLRQDYVSLIWLLMEVNDMGQEHANIRVPKECLPHMPKESYLQYCRRYTEIYLKERELPKLDEDGKLAEETGIFPGSVSEIEDRLAYILTHISDMHVPEGMHPLDVYFKDKSNAEVKSILRSHEHNFKTILVRIRSRVSNYFSEVESQIAYSDVQSDVYFRYRSYVDSCLLNRIPEAYKKFTCANEHVDKDDPESFSHALLSCRRILKLVADELYPPPGRPVIGADGKQRNLTEDQFISRLWQFIYETAGKHVSGQLLMEQVNDLGRRLDRLNELASKGVHSEVTMNEVDQCIIQTYIALGDILRLSELHPKGSGESLSK